MKALIFPFVGDTHVNMIYRFCETRDLAKKIQEKLRDIQGVAIVREGFFLYATVDNVRLAQHELASKGFGCELI